MTLVVAGPWRLVQAGPHRLAVKGFRANSPRTSYQTVASLVVRLDSKVPKDGVLRLLWYSWGPYTYGFRISPAATSLSALDQGADLKATLVKSKLVTVVVPLDDLVLFRATKYDRELTVRGVTPVKVRRQGVDLYLRARAGRVRASAMARDAVVVHLDAKVLGSSLWQRSQGTATNSGGLQVDLGPFPEGWKQNVPLSAKVRIEVELVEQVWPVQSRALFPKP